jgi:hypothetical protein
LAAKETNGRFKNAEFTVTRGTRATYVGRDGLIKESNLQDVNLVNNGTFDTDSNWITGDAWSIENGKAVAISGVSGKIRQTNTLNGKYVKVTLTVSNYGGTGLLLVDFGSVNSPYITSNGTHTFYGAYDQNDFEIYKSSPFTGSIDNISVQEVKTDTPRIDFTDNTDGHLLLEPQSTNLITYSEDFSEWTTEANVEVTDNSINSPDGTQNAAKLQLTGSSSGTDGKISFAVSPNATTHTFSVFAKKGNHDYIYIWMNISGGTNITRWIDLDDGSVNVGSGTATVTTTSFSNDWWKIEYTFDATDLSSIRLEVADDSASTGTGGDNIYVWGAQLEELPYVTSYIPTNGSTVTRDAETCTDAGSSADFNSEEGVLYAEIAALANDGIAREITLNDGTEDNRVIISYNTSNQIRINYRKSGSNIFDQTHTTTTTDYNKIAIKWELNSFRFYVNGTQIASSSSGAVMSANTLNTIDFDNYTGSFKFNGKCKAIRVYKEALSDTDLENLTS